MSLSFCVTQNLLGYPRNQTFQFALLLGSAWIYREREADGILTGSREDRTLLSSSCFLDTHHRCDLLLGLIPTSLKVIVSSCLDRHMIFLIEPRALVPLVFELEVPTRYSLFSLGPGCFLKTSCLGGPE